MFTYVLMDEFIRFSETGLSFIKDNLSKHAVHSNVAYQVRYSGEFHIRPSKIKNSYKLVIDNNSGTYSPDKNYLSLLEKVLMINFPDIEVEALDRKDPVLEEYLKNCVK
eukprot:TRINITY_DN36229_c0_g1_i2.p2 TRINITY_DN36229_c0_g1~~TRINITY_DN36229_c0_g1_i2.p2  ORF type:complete len:109 (+),score=19.37 TRINITY_DN36229_c0_g1_i2:742-1068(+)